MLTSVSTPTLEECSSGGRLSSRDSTTVTVEEPHRTVSKSRRKWTTPRPTAATSLSSESQILTAATGTDMRTTSQPWEHGCISWRQTVTTARTVVWSCGHMRQLMARLGRLWTSTLVVEMGMRLTSLPWEHGCTSGERRHGQRNEHPVVGTRDSQWLDVAGRANRFITISGHGVRYAYDGRRYKTLRQREQAQVMNCGHTRPQTARRGRPRTSSAGSATRIRGIS